MKDGQIVWIKGKEMFGKVLSFDKEFGKYNVRGENGKNYKLPIGNLKSV